MWFGVQVILVALISLALLAVFAGSRLLPGRVRHSLADRVVVGVGVGTAVVCVLTYVTLREVFGVSTLLVSSGALTALSLVVYWYAGTWVYSCPIAAEPSDIASCMGRRRTYVRMSALLVIVSTGCGLGRYGLAIHSVRAGEHAMSAGKEDLALFSYAESWDYGKPLKLHPLIDTSFTHYARLLHTSSQHQRMEMLIEEFDQLIKLNISNLTVGDLYSSVGLQEMAEHRYKTFLRNGGHIGTGNMRLANLYVTTRDSDALGLLVRRDNLLDLRSGDPDDNAFVGDVLFSIDAWNRAISYYRHTIDLDPNFNGAVYYRVARCYLRNGNQNLALEALERAASLTQDATSINYWRGKCLLSLNDENGAASAFRAALTTCPEHMPSLLALRDLSETSSERELIGARIEHLSPNVALNLALVEDLTLLGYELRSQELMIGDTLEIVLFLSIERPVSEAHRLSFRVGCNVDPDSASFVIVQGVDFVRPIESWRVGEVVIQKYHFPVTPYPEVVKANGVVLPRPREFRTVTNCEYSLSVLVRKWSTESHWWQTVAGTEREIATLRIL